MSVDEIRRQLPSFFRCPLPDSCIDFTSIEGKRLFKESLRDGDAEIFFKLSSHFHTQAEPQWSCGISALAMVLNSLQIDPTRRWRHYWRYFDEWTVEKGKTIEQIKKDGIDLLELSEVARNNGAEAVMRICEQEPGSLEAFRGDVRKSVQSDETALIVSYWRNVVGQMGDGHFSPIGAYHESSDRVLLMEVSRYKYNPHWIRVTDLHRAMCVHDPSMSTNRGYLLVKSKDPENIPRFGLDTSDCYRNQETLSALQHWTAFLANEKLEDPLENEEILRNLTKIFPKTLFIMRKMEEIEKDLNNNEEKTEFSIDFGDFRDFSKLDQLHSLLLLSWPYVINHSQRSERLRIMADEWSKKEKKSSQMQIESLQQQIIVYLECLRTL